MRVQVMIMNLIISLHSSTLREFVALSRRRNGDWVYGNGILGFPLGGMGKVIFVFSFSPVKEAKGKERRLLTTCAKVRERGTDEL